MLQILPSFRTSVRTKFYKAPLTANYLIIMVGADGIELDA